MKNVKVILLTVLFCSSYFLASANSMINPEKAVQQMQSQLSEMILDADMWSAKDVGTTVKLKFMVSNDNEIIVLSTDSDRYDAQIKDLLNYESINVDSSLHNQVFILPVRLDK